jgi:hypothetical protein
VILISHRSNLKGPYTAEYGENHPSSIEGVINKEFDVEVDVWLIGGKYILGHDNPQYEVNLSFLKNSHFWCHAKNLEALHSLIRENIHCFFHDIDAATLTSRGWIWTYPGQPILSDRAIVVMPERITNYDISKAGGICSDFILQCGLT